MVKLLYSVIQSIQPFLVPFCGFFAWTFIVLLGWSLWSAMHEAAAKAKQMHEIPCTGCRFFTNDYRLKCTVQPSLANTEEAIHCSDRRPREDTLAHWLN
jgi:hypothetical protein